MWTFLNDAYFSIVADRENSNLLLVRSRFRGDIEKYFPKAKVIEMRDADYRFRTFVSRQELKKVLNKVVDDIDYDNFKNSVDETWRHNTYLDVWSVMYSTQNRMYGQRTYKTNKYGEVDWISEYLDKKNYKTKP